jgi:hypothetical protein
MGQYANRMAEGGKDKPSDTFLTYIMINFQDL